MFYLAGDDECALYMSTNDKPENKEGIIHLRRYTNKDEWARYVSIKILRHFIRCWKISEG